MVTYLIIVLVGLVVFLAIAVRLGLSLAMAVGASDVVHRPMESKSLLPQ